MGQQFRWVKFPSFTQNNGDFGISHDLRPLRPQNSTGHQSIDRTVSTSSASCLVTTGSDLGADAAHRWRRQTKSAPQWDPTPSKKKVTNFEHGHKYGVTTCYNRNEAIIYAIVHKKIHHFLFAFDMLWNFIRWFRPVWPQELRKGFCHSGRHLSYHRTIDWSL